MVMEGPFDEQGYDYSGQALPSLSSTLLQGKGADTMNVHSIQVMLGLQQQHDMFGGMGSPKLDGSPMHHQDLGLFQQQQQQQQTGLEVANGVKRKPDDVVLLQAQADLQTANVGPAPKKSDKKKADNNGVKKKKTR